MLQFSPVTLQLGLVQFQECAEDSITFSLSLTGTQTQYSREIINSGCLDPPMTKVTLKILKLYVRRKLKVN